MSDTNDTVLAGKKEVTANTNPGGAFTPIPWVSETLKAQGNYSQSNLVRSDGNVKDLIRNSLIPQNGFVGELGFGYYDEYIEAAYRSTFSAANTVAASTLSIVGSGPFTLDDSGNGLGGFAVFDVIHVKGFTTTANNGVYVVTSVAAGSIGIVAVEKDRTPSAEGAGDAVSVTTSRMSNANLNTSFTLEKKLVGSADFYHAYNNMRVNTMNLEVAAESEVGIGFDFIGEGHSLTQQSGSLATDPSDSEDPLNTDNHFAGVAIGEGTTGLTSLAVADACITRMVVNINNNVRRDTALNCNEMGKGKFICRVDLDVYFKNNDMFAHYVNDTSISLAGAIFNSNTNKGYGFNFRKLRIQDAESLAGGGDQPQLARFITQAVLDSAGQSSQFFKIDNS